MKPVVPCWQSVPSASAHNTLFCAFIHLSNGQHKSTQTHPRCMHGSVHVNKQVLSQEKGLFGQQGVQPRNQNWNCGPPGAKLQVVVEFLSKGP